MDFSRGQLPRATTATEKTPVIAAEIRPVVAWRWSPAAWFQAEGRWVLLVLLATLVAAAVRAAALTGKALVFDETFSVFLARQPLDRLWALVAANDPHPPLYYILLHYWVVSFGDSEVAVRAFSVAAGAATVLITGLFGRRLVGPLPALLGAWFLALAPAHVAASQEARMYGLLAAMGTASWWALYEAVRSGRGRLWVVYGLLTALMWYTHYFGFLIWIAQGIYVGWTCRSRPIEVGKWILAGSGALLLLLPWVPSLLEQIAAGRGWPVYRPAFHWSTVLETLWGMTAGGPIAAAEGLGGWTIGPVEPDAAVLVAAAAVVILLAAAVRRNHARGWPVGLLLLAALVPVLLAGAISMRLNVFSPRYVVFVVPPIALLLATGVARVSEIRTRWAPWVAAGLVGAVLVPNALALGDFYRRPRMDDFDWRMLAQTVSRRARSDDAMVFLPGFSLIPVDYYFRGPQLRMALTPNGTEVIGPGGIGMREVGAALKPHPRVWILIVPPIPPAADGLLRMLQRDAFKVTGQGRVHRTYLILMERVAAR